MLNPSLLVWSCRAFKPVNPFSLNHSWVTTYAAKHPNGFTDPRKEYYWYCWGEFHSGTAEDQQPSPYQALKGPLVADLELAKCICQPNTPSNPGRPSWPSAGIEGAYGVGGVCHQVANRILWSAGIQAATKEAYTVEGTRGWQLSWDIFGPYGYGNDPSNWIEVLNRCSGLGPDGLNLIKRMNKSRPKLHKRISDRLRSILEKVLKDKEGFDAKRMDRSLSAEQHAHAVNGLVRKYLVESAAVIGRRDFKEYFGAEFTEDIAPVVVDPVAAAFYEKLEDKAVNNATFGATP